MFLLLLLLQQRFETIAYKAGCGEARNECHGDMKRRVSMLNAMQECLHAARRSRVRTRHLAPAVRNGRCSRGCAVHATRGDLRRGAYVCFRRGRLSFWQQRTQAADAWGDFHSARRLHKDEEAVRSLQSVETQPASGVQGGRNGRGERLTRWRRKSPTMPAAARPPIGRAGKQTAAPIWAACPGATPGRPCQSLLPAPSTAPVSSASSTRPFPCTAFLPLQSCIHHPFLSVCVASASQQLHALPISSRARCSLLTTWLHLTLFDRTVLCFDFPPLGPIATAIAIAIPARCEPATEDQNNKTPSQPLHLTLETPRTPGTVANPAACKR